MNSSTEPTVENTINKIVFLLKMQLPIRITKQEAVFTSEDVTALFETLIQEDLVQATTVLNITVPLNVSNAAPKHPITITYEEDHVDYTFAYSKETKNFYIHLHCRLTRYLMVLGHAQ